MPYRHAHWWLWLLFPAIVIAFWPGYFGQLRAAPLALHGHGISASVWLILLAIQLWSIHARRAALHRAAGRALFVVVPLFAGSSLAAIQGGIALYAARSDPFHTTFSTRLALVDLIALLTFVWLVWFAVAERRRVRLHAAAMLATALLVLPPILGRLVPIAPGFGEWDVAGRTGFALAFHIGVDLSVLGAFCLYLDDRTAWPLMVAAISNALQGVSFETIGASDTWTRIALASLAIRPALLFLGGAALTAAILILAWRRVPPRESSRTPLGLRAASGIAARPSPRAPGR